MAEEEDLTEEEVEDGEDGESSDARPKRKLSGKAIVLFVVAPLLVIGLGTAGAWLAGLFGGEETEQVVEKKEEPKVFYDLPEMLVNLASHGDSRAQYLKVQISIELPGEEARDSLEPVLPRVVDLFQVYLRELRTTDLEGSAGIYRLKEELERRINMEIHPFTVSDVLFREIIVQ